MRRAIIYSCLIGQLVIFCLASKLFESITLFVLFGVVPWQSTPLSPQVMLSIYSLIIATLIVVSFRKQITHFSASLRTNRSRAQA